MIANTGIKLSNKNDCPFQVYMVNTVNMTFVLTLSQWFCDISSKTDLHTRV